MSFNNIIVEVKGGIGYVTINRPDKLNALNIETIQEIKLGVEHCRNQNVAGIILTGSGEKAFAAGADIQEFANFSGYEAHEMSQDGHAVFDYIENSNTPIIAAVNGFALGGGCELAMACHFRIASDNAALGLPELSLGLIPGYGGTQRLPNIIGQGLAIQYTLTSDKIDSAEAFRIGLVNEVVPLENLLARCEAIIHKISKKGPLAVKRALECIQGFYNPNVNGFMHEMKAFGESFETEDFREGVEAFLEKRKANFNGK